MPQPSTTIPRPPDAVLLDLDGTITDSAPVILDALEVTLSELGLPVPSREDLMAYVGPPLVDGFQANAGLTGQELPRAVSTYRRHYRERMCEAPLYPGVPEVLAALATAGIPVSLATSKREVLAAQILRHWDLDTFFTVIAGADAADRHGGKAEVIGDALARLALAGVRSQNVVHVGDRGHDVRGAHEAGILSIGVLWGYGDAEELAGATALAASPADLATLLGLSL